MSINTATTTVSNNIDKVAKTTYKKIKKKRKHLETKSGVTLIFHRNRSY
jgi:hypothetical protein